MQCSNEPVESFAMRARIESDEMSAAGLLDSFGPHDSADPLLATRVPTMSVQLDHTMVPSRDRKAAAELLGTLLGVPWSESAVGPFCAVYVNEGLTLDVDQVDDSFPVQHYCFRVSEAEFDGIVTRIKACGIEYRSTPHGPADMQINTQHGGRIVYWSEPDGHVWEALTVSYARQPGKWAQGDAQPVDAPVTFRVGPLK